MEERGLPWSCRPQQRWMRRRSYMDVWTCEGMDVFTFGRPNIQTSTPKSHQWIWAYPPIQW